MHEDQITTLSIENFFLELNKEGFFFNPRHNGKTTTSKLLEKAIERERLYPFYTFPFPSTPLLPYQKAYLNYMEKPMTSVSKTTRGYQAIVGSLRPDTTLSFAERPVIHTSEVSAKAEVTRLAKNNPGTMYVYLELKGIAKAADVTWV